MCVFFVCVGECVCVRVCKLFLLSHKRFTLSQKQNITNQANETQPFYNELAPKIEICLIHLSFI